MTRRERLEARLERRRTWKASRDAETQRAYTASQRLLEGIPLGQPILVGHHSEGRHRRTLERSDALMHKAVDAGKMAAHHAGRAANLEHQLERAIFSDDPDAVPALEQRAQQLEAERERLKAINVAWRAEHKPEHADDAGWARVAARLGVELATLRRQRADMELCPWHRQPVPSYALSNLGGEVRRTRQRIVSVQRQAALQTAAQDAGGVKVDDLPGGYTRVVFAEHPGRATVEAMRAAQYHWSAPGWIGRTDLLPASVRLLADTCAAAPCAKSQAQEHGADSCPYGD